MRPPARQGMRGKILLPTMRANAFPAAISSTTSVNAKRKRRERGCSLIVGGMRARRRFTSGDRAEEKSARCAGAASGEEPPFSRAFRPIELTNVFTPRAR